MATNPASRPKGRSIRSLRMVWGFALHYPGHIAVAALALLVAAGATSGVPYAFKLIIDKGFASGAGSNGDIARWFKYLLMLVAVMALATAVRRTTASWENNTSKRRQPCTFGPVTANSGATTTSVSSSPATATS